MFPSRGTVRYEERGQGYRDVEKVGKHCFKLLHPTGHVMHHQFNIQQLYSQATLYLCGLYLSENKQRLVPLTA